MSHYIIIPIGFIIGLSIIVTIQSTRVHMNDKYEESFWQAVVKYLKKSTGRLILSVLIMFTAMFILPDLVANLSSKNSDAVKHHAIIENILSWMRSYSVFLGISAESIGFWIVNRKEKIFNETNKD